MKAVVAVRQRGAVLIIALVMLLALTLLVTQSMRSVTQETRLNNAAMQSNQLLYELDAALREGEFRFYGSAYLRDKLEPDPARNCVKANTLALDGKNRPCVLAELDRAQLQRFFTAPVRFFQDDSAAHQLYAARTAAAVQAAGANTVLAWMPYRGLDPQPAHYVQVVAAQQAYWNSYRIDTGAQGVQVTDPEYGAALEGRGTFYYLITAQVGDRLAAQSTLAMLYLGLNQSR